MMKKTSLFMFTALLLVNSLTAKPNIAAPAKIVETAPVVAANDSMSSQAATPSRKWMGITFGVSAGYVTDMFKQGTNLSKIAGAAGGGAYQTASANANLANQCVAVNNLAGSTNCSGSGSGSDVNLTGLDMGLKVQYDVLPWLFVRSGVNYTMGFKNTYTLTSAWTSGAGVQVTDSATITANGNMLEVPMLVGFNFISNESGSLYMAAGLNYNSGSYDFNMSLNRTVSAGTAPTFQDVNNNTKQSGLGVMWLIGGRVKVAKGIAVFGDVKFLAAAAVASGAVTGTSFAAGNSYANSGPVNTFLTSAAVGAATPQVIQSNGGGTATGTGGLDLSYTRWQLGIQYEL